MVYTFFDKKTGSGVRVHEQLAEELHKTVMKKSQLFIMHQRCFH